MVRQCAGNGAVWRDRQARSTDAVRLVEDLRPGSSPLRHGGRRPHDLEVPRRNRLAPAAQSYGAVLGGAADRAPQLPIHLPERAALRTPMVDERAARAA